MKRSIIRIVFLLLIAGIPLVLLICNEKISVAAQGRLYDRVETVPYNKVGLLLGTSKYNAAGNINAYYAYRINAAAGLIKAGKIKYLVISGDNKTHDYNEPEMMRRDLINAGIDSTILYLDFAGFRTFDSIVRLRKIFGQNSVTIISQPFHNERALFIASKEGIEAIAYNAQDVDREQGIRTQLREKFARVKVYIDYLTGKKPKFLGERVFLPEN